MSLPLLFIAGAISVFVVGVQVSRRSKRAQRKTPPGPPPRFLVGNLFDIPSTGQAEEYITWGEKYNSSLVFATAAGTNILVLNKRSDAEELFDRRSRIYSDRPDVPVLPLLGWAGVNTAFLPYGSAWRLHKKVYQEHLRPAVLSDHHPLLYRTVGRLLQDVLDSSSNAMDHIKLFSMTLPLDLMYGYAPSSANDPAILSAEESLQVGATLYLPGSTLANTFPILLRLPSWMPGASFKRKAAHVKKLTEETIRIPWEYVQMQVAQGTNLPSVLSRHLEGQNPHADDSRDKLEALLGAAYTAYGAASDTTTSVLLNLVYMMIAYPDVQRKAWESLEKVVGRKRLPTFDDREDLPYISAILYEILRLRSPVPLAIPHVLTEDDHYQGYFIPKGTICMANVVAMSRDSEIYEDPNIFNPDRFLNQDGTLRTEENPHYVFGFGRRSCAGKHFAREALWISIACLLAAFEFTHFYDDEGKEAPIDPGLVDNGLLRAKSPFICNARPRSPGVRQIIETFAGSGSD